MVGQPASSFSVLFHVDGVPSLVVWGHAVRLVGRRGCAWKAKCAEEASSVVVSNINMARGRDPVSVPPLSLGCRAGMAWLKPLSPFEGVPSPFGILAYRCGLLEPPSHLDVSFWWFLPRKMQP